METTELKVLGMDCGGCETSINKALAKLGGVESSTASFEAGAVEVTFDPARVTMAQIGDAIADAGFEVLSGAGT